MEAVIEKECSALGGLFQTTISDMKVRGLAGALWIRGDARGGVGGEKNPPIPSAFCKPAQEKGSTSDPPDSWRWGG